MFEFKEHCKLSAREPIAVVRSSNSRINKFGQEWEEKAGQSPGLQQILGPMPSFEPKSINPTFLRFTS
jgi:hypothetical protein